MYAFGGIKPGKFGLDLREGYILAHHDAERQGFKDEQVFLIGAKPEG